MKQLFNSYKLTLFFLLLFLPMFVFVKVSYAQTTADWFTLGANSARTSWVSQESSATLSVLWYKPIEAYIPQHVQLITVNNIIYVATAKGLYALRADNGSTVWKFDTELPLGHSPTVFEGRVYVAGHDKNLYVLDATTGQLLWTFSQAGAGYSANPLVVKDSFTGNQALVLIGSRDGNFYAIGGHGHTRQGQIIWRYTMPDNVPIIMSAAYKDGIVYTTALNNKLYALRVNTTNAGGDLKWASTQFMGEPFTAYWPVIYQDKVILSKTSDIRDGGRPGSRSITSYASPNGYDVYTYAERDSVSLPLGDILPPVSWSRGFSVNNVRKVFDYLEQPDSRDEEDPAGRIRYNHKPWRRQYYVINQSDGTEFTWDVDGDGNRDYLPILYWRAESGPMYPPAVSGDLAYFTAVDVPAGMTALRGNIRSWNVSDPGYLGMTPQQGPGFAPDEPLALSLGGNRGYTSMCCDRLAESISLFAGQGTSYSSYWRYTLSGSGLAPGYDEMWWLFTPNIDRHQGSYKGIRDFYGTQSDGIFTTNASFNSHGVQNPLVPHNGRLFIHRSNAIIALGTETGLGKINYQPIAAATRTVSEPNLNSLLEREINKMLNAGHLKPGYYVQNQFEYSEAGTLPNYFNFPGETLWALANAYPYISSTLQSRLATYLREEWSMYFYPTSYATRGYANGVQRNSAPLPPEITSDYANLPALTATSAHSWQYPQHSIYGMWKYAEKVPVSQRPSNNEIYQVARSKILTSLSYDERRPYEYNAWIAGLKGFMELYRLAGSPSADTSLFNNVSTAYNNALSTVRNNFTKDSWAYPSGGVRHKLDTARPFIWLTPELADYMATNLSTQVDTALDEYTYINPYWFVNRFENDMGESSTQGLYSYHALFLAKAWIKNAPRREIVKYLDAPAFERGDLFYIQNLVATIEAPSDGSPTSTPLPTPTGRPGDANGDGRVDGIDYVIWLGNYNQAMTGPSNGDFNNSGRVDGADYVIWLTNYGS